MFIHIAIIMKLLLDTKAYEAIQDLHHLLRPKARARDRG